jgi:hypothetical protein
MAMHGDAERLRRLAGRMEGRTLKVIGLGGIGSPVAQALAQFLSASAPGAVPLYLVDGDAFEERNRARVAFQAGGNKAVSKAQELSLVYGHAVTIVPVPRYATPYNLHRLLDNGDCVMLAVDNHQTRKAVSRRCERLSDVLLISGGNDGIENGREGTYGNVMLFERSGGRDVTSPLTRFHPEIARPEDKRPDELGCAALAGSAPQLLFTNLAVAAAMLAAFYGWLTRRGAHEEIFLDISRQQMHGVHRSRSVP